MFSEWLNPVTCCRRMRAKMLADPMSPEDVAGGWALGMFVGCAIPFGMQLIVSIPLAMMMRVSKIGATLGTFLTNPVTIFFIYPAQTWLTHRLLFGPMDYEQIDNLTWTWATVKTLSGPLVVSFFVGGLILAIVLSPITYFAVRSLVRGSRRRRERRNANKGE